MVLSVQLGSFLQSRGLHEIRSNDLRRNESYLANVGPVTSFAAVSSFLEIPCITVPRALDELHHPRFYGTCCPSSPAPSCISSILVISHAFRRSFSLSCVTQSFAPILHFHDCNPMSFHTDSRRLRIFRRGSLDPFISY
jgi:hypothetical protein